MKKSKLETEDLLSLLDKPDDIIPDKQIDDENIGDVLRFLNKFTIIPGEDLIKRQTLYNIYKVWSLEPAQKLDFLVEVGNYLPQDDEYFWINQNAIKLTYAVFQQYEENEKLKEPNRLKLFQQFQRKFNVYAGNFWIEDYLLHYIYVKKNPRFRVTEKVFYKFCKINLPVKKTMTGKLYGVSESIVSLLPQGQLKLLKEEYAKEKEEKQKKSAKIPRPRRQVQLKNKS